MRKFKVECLFGSFGGEDTHWQEVEAENYEQAEEKAKPDYQKEWLENEFFIK